MRRRHFLGSVPLALAGGAALAREAAAPRAPEVTTPRATSGDRIEPKWESRLTVTVGPEKADLVGTGNKAIQAAVDYVARLGGGTVHILPGTYRLRNAIYLQSGVRILGSGADSILMKEPSTKTKLALDSDWYDQEVTLEDAKGFEVGDGIVLNTRNPHNGSYDTHKRTLIARSGNRFKLDQMLEENFWLKEGATAATLFALLDGMRIADVTIENITLDGNKSQNDFLNGNYVGCIFLRESRDIQIRGVTARNFNGDAISWQVCHDVRVENCHSHDNGGYGVHPGSGSQRTVVVNNRLERNEIGFFFCWGVKWGLCEGNTIVGNRKFGVSVGHNDTDNLIRKNEVRESGQVGVLFRREHGPAFSPNRNRLEDNRIVDSGAEKGIGVKVEGQTQSVEIARNEIRETRNPAERVGILIEPETRDIRLAGNTIEGFARAVTDLRST
ncbi:MAG: right-handed parallel beta-helix repeat-containing protein [Bryobacteraceae bacterium]|nr:right-handed parallel beta-helix repeat-containing protein [Bryobacteraceae bacterium]